MTRTKKKTHGRMIKIEEKPDGGGEERREEGPRTNPLIDACFFQIVSSRRYDSVSQITYVRGAAGSYPAHEETTPLSETWAMKQTALVDKKCN